MHLKAEGLQRAGAFKFRGAYNTISSLTDDELARGVCAGSSGNHAQAVALAARLCGTRATILMPRDAPASKRAATEGYGAEIVEYDRYGEDRDELVAALAAESGFAVVHAYDDPRVMAGAGTAALELLEDVGALDLLLVPVGGGGLISGCATVVKALSPATRVVGVEPLASDDVARSKASGRRERVAVGRTIADGQQLPTPGVHTWRVIDTLVDDVVTVTDEQIVSRDAAALRAPEGRRRAERRERAGRAARRRAARGRQPRRRRPVGREHRRGAVRDAARRRRVGRARRSRRQICRA